MPVSTRPGTAVDVAFARHEVQACLDFRCDQHRLLRHVGATHEQPSALESALIVVEAGIATSMCS